MDPDQCFSGFGTIGRYGPKTGKKPLRTVCSKNLVLISKIGTVADNGALIRAPFFREPNLTFICVNGKEELVQTTFLIYPNQTFFVV